MSDPRPVRVSATPSIAANWLAHRIADFATARPDIDLDVQGTSTFVDLDGEDIDIAIRFIERPVPGYYCAVLFEEPLFPVCSPAYLMKIGTLNTPADLSRAALLRCPRMQDWKTWFEAAGLDWPEPTSGLKFSEYPLLLEAAANGAGVALVGEILSAGHLRSGRVLRLFDISVAQRRKYYICCREDKLARDEVAAVVKWLLEEAQAHVFKGAQESLGQSDIANTVFDRLPAGAMYVREESITFNSAVEAIIGYKRSEIISLDAWFAKLYGRRAESMHRLYETEKRSGRPVSRTGTIVTKDGKSKIVQFSSLPSPQGVVWLMLDVTERSQIEERIRRIAFHDQLTSIANRVLFIETLDAAIKHARDQAASLAVLFIDLDGFKAINDELGHAAGDEVLRAVAKQLTRAIRETDCAARFGGDEFAVLLNGSDRMASVQSANRILTSVREPILLGTATRHVGASIGIALYPEHGVTSSELMEHADKAMYLCKAAGKNRVEIFGAKANVN